MLSLLCAGTLLRDPERRTGAKGNSYATALLRVPTEGEDSVLGPTSGATSSAWPTSSPCATARYS